MDIFTALADPTRRRILKMLSRRQLAAGAIADNFEEMSIPAVSQHLKALREANLVVVENDGKQRIYSYNPSGLKALNHFLNQLQ